jgi:hypothetical protein
MSVSVEQVIGWHHSVHHDVLNAVGDTLIPNYDLMEDGCMSLDLWNHIKSLVVKVEGVWVVNLKPGQHVHVTRLQIHAAYNHSFCISLNSTPNEEVSNDELPDTIRILGQLLLLSTCGDARQSFIQNRVSLGHGFNDLYCAVVRRFPPVAGSSHLVSNVSLHDRINIAMWGGEMELSLHYLMECRKNAKVQLPGFSNKEIKKKIADLRRALGFAGGENKGIKRKAGDA